MQPISIESIKEAQTSDVFLKMMEEIPTGKRPCIDRDLLFEGRLSMLNIHELMKEILDEAHGSPYSIHPRSTKMYWNL